MNGALLQRYFECPQCAHRASLLFFLPLWRTLCARCGNVGYPIEAATPLRRVDMRIERTELLLKRERLSPTGRRNRLRLERELQVLLARRSAILERLAERAGDGDLEAFSEVVRRAVRGPEGPSKEVLPM